MIYVIFGDHIHEKTSSRTSLRDAMCSTIHSAICHDMSTRVFIQNLQTFNNGTSRTMNHRLRNCNKFLCDELL